MNNGLSVVEAFPEPEYSSYIELSLEIVSKIRNPGSWTGWAYGAPMAPGNMSNIPRQDLIEQAKAAGYAHFLLTGKNPIIIPIGCGWYYLNGVDEKYLPSVCPQWP
jgi:hypothetical protein